MKNGKLAKGMLKLLSWCPDKPMYYVRADVWAGIERLNKAFKAEFGHNLPINYAYRSYAEQLALYRKFGYPRANYPGNSNHGWALAVDIGGLGGTSGKKYKWLKARKGLYGLVQQAWYVRHEPWHWNIKPGKDRSGGGTAVAKRTAWGYSKPSTGTAKQRRKNLLHIRKKGYKLTYVEKRLVNGILWLITKAGTWYRASAFGISI